VLEIPGNFFRPNQKSVRAKPLTCLPGTVHMKIFSDIV